MSQTAEDFDLLDALSQGAKGKYDPNATSAVNVSSADKTIQDNSPGVSITIAAKKPDVASSTNSAALVPSGADDSTQAQRAQTANASQGKNEVDNFDLLSALDLGAQNKFVNDTETPVDDSGTLKDNSWSNVAGAVPSGLYSGVASNFNLPGAVYNAAVNLLTGLGGNQPVPGEAQPTLQPVPDVVDTNPTGYAPGSQLARDVYSGAANVGAAAAMPAVGGVVGALGRGLEAGTTADAAQALGKGLQDTALTPKTVGGAAVGGVVGQQAEDAAPEPLKPIANIAGQLVGDSAINLGAGLKDTVTNRLIKQEVTTPDGRVIPLTANQQDNAAKELYQAIGGEQGKADLANAANTESDVPGYKRDVAQALAPSSSDTSGLNVIGAAAALHDPAAFIARNQQNQTALANDIRSIEPKVPSSGVLVPFVEQQNADEQTFANNLTRLKAAQDNATAALGVSPTDQQLGAGLRGRLAQIMDANQRAASARYNSIDPSYTATTQRAVDLANNFRSVATNEGNKTVSLGAGSGGDSEAKLYEDIANLPPVMPIRSIKTPQGAYQQTGIESLQSRIASLRGAAASTGDREQLARLSSMDSALRQSIENAATDKLNTTVQLSPNMPPVVTQMPNFTAPSPAQASEHAAIRQNYADVMSAAQQGATGDVLQRGEPRGAYSLADGDVLNSILNGGSTQAERTHEILDKSADDPTSFIPQQIEHGLINQLRSGSNPILSPEGVIDSKRANNWFNSRLTQDTLNHPALADVKQRIQNAIRSQDMFDAEMARQSAEREQFAKTIAGKFLASDDPTHPEITFNKLISDKSRGPQNLIDLVRALRGNPAGIKGAQQLLAEYINDKLMTPEVAADDNLGAQTTRLGQLKQKQFNEFINEYHNGIKALMSGTGRNSIERVGREITRTQDAAIRTALGNSATAERLMANRLNKTDSVKHNDTVYALIADRFGENLSHMAREKAGEEIKHSALATIGHVVGGPIAAGVTLGLSSKIKALQAANIKNANDLRVAMFQHPDLANLLLQRVGADGKLSGIWQKKFAAALQNQVIIGGMADLTKDRRGLPRVQQSQQQTQNQKNQ